MTIIDYLKIVWHILGLVATEFINRGALDPSYVIKLLVFYLAATVIFAFATEIYFSIHILQSIVCICV